MTPDKINKMIEKTVSSKMIFKGSFLNVVLDDIEIEDTEIKSKRLYIEHNGGVCIVPVLDNGDLVLIKQFRTPLKKVIYEFPAGKIDPGESTLETAKRELKEETGYNAKSWQEIGETYPSPGYSTELLHIYIAKDLSAGETDLDHGEFVEVEKMSLKDALSKVQSGEIRDSKTINGLFFLTNTFDDKSPI